MLLGDKNAEVACATFSQVLSLIQPLCQVQYLPDWMSNQVWYGCLEHEHTYESHHLRSGGFVVAVACLLHANICNICSFIICSSLLLNQLITSCLYWLLNISWCIKIFWVNYLAYFCMLHYATCQWVKTILMCWSNVSTKLLLSGWCQNESRLSRTQTFQLCSEYSDAWIKIQCSKIILNEFSWFWWLCVCYNNYINTSIQLIVYFNG